MRSSEVELAFQAKSIVGEVALWDERIQRLYWVDILNARFFQFDPITGENKVFQLDQFVGVVVPGNENTVYLALKDGFAAYDLSARNTVCN